MPDEHTFSLIHNEIDDRLETMGMMRWQYASGDEQSRSDIEFNADDWIYVNPFMPSGSAISDQWTGIGWFRCRFHVDSTLWGKSMAFLYMQTGAAEIFLNGNLIHRLGKPSHDPDAEEIENILNLIALPCVLGGSSTQVLAVRYSNHQSEYPQRFGLPIGFYLTFMDFEEAVEVINNRLKNASSFQMFFTGIPLAFSLIHMLLFLFYRKSRQNLYYSAYAFSMGALTFVANQDAFVKTLHAFSINYWLFKLTLIAIAITGLRFIYSLFYEQPPRMMRVAWGIGIVMIFLSGSLNHYYFYSAAMIASLEQVRVFVGAFRRRVGGTWIVGIGFTCLIFGTGYQMLSDMGIIPRFIPIPQIYQWGFVGMLLSMSVYLARDYSHINISLHKRIDEVRKLSETTLKQERQVREQEIERLRLEEENKRRLLELEEARKLQKVLDDLEQSNIELEETNRELRVTQSQLVQSEKMASLGMLVAGIAHEINTPVGAIGSMHNTLVRAVSKLRDRIESFGSSEDSRIADVENYIQVIEDGNKVISSGTERVTKIVKRLRSFARLDEAEIKEVNIHDGIDDTLTIVNHELKHKVEILKNYGDPPQISCFPGQLNQVFLNLLINAAQAIKEKGIIKISTSLMKDYIIIEIEDDGVGIDEESLPKVFDPGFTTKGVGVGTGLGLSICYQIIQDHHGKITVSSELGVGSTFRIELPINLEEKLKEVED